MGDGRRSGLTARRLAALAWLVLLTVLVWMPPPPTPRLDLPWLDEAVHFALFFGLGGLGVWAAYPSRFVVGFGIAWGVITELGQGVLPWLRTPDVVDAVFDALGVVVGVAFAAWVLPTSNRAPDGVGGG